MDDMKGVRTLAVIWVLGLILQELHVRAVSVTTAATAGYYGEENSFNMGTFLNDLFSESSNIGYIHPNADQGQPTVVEVDVYINNIGSFDAGNMDFTAQIFLRQRWNDPRLKYTEYNHSVFLDQKLFNNIWVPDLFILNEKEGQFHELTVPNRLIELTPDGGVLYSSRLTFKLACDMNLARFPMDSQLCDIHLETYGYTTKDLQFQWRLSEPLSFRKGVELPEFHVVGNYTEECVQRYSTGPFSCLIVRIKLQRQLSYYLAQTYIPTTLMVMLSWVSFWIDMDAVPARVSLGLLTVLTMTTHGSGISFHLPKVSYLKAIDIWMTICLAFVFGGLIEFSVVNVLSRKYSLQKSSATRESQTDDCKVVTGQGNILPGQEPSVQLRRIQPQDTLNVRSRRVCIVDDNIHQVAAEEETQGMLGILFSRVRKWWEKVKRNRALMVDVISRFLFPLVFIVFNIFYWTHYLHGLSL